MGKHREFVEGQRIGNWIYIKEVEPRYYTNESINYTYLKRHHLLECSNCGHFSERGQDTFTTLKKSKCTVCKMLPQGQTGLNMLFRQYSDRAELHEAKMLLTMEQFKNLTSRNCHYCGVEPMLSIKAKGTPGDWGTYYYNGIDRVENSNHNYEIGNCVPCCHDCNISKRDMTTKEFYGWIDQLISFHLETQRGN